MRAAVWNAKGTLDVIERPLPEPKPGWVRVAVSATGICGTDLHFFRGAFPSPVGGLPGHEIGGVIDASDDPALVPGTPVAIEPLIVCGRCAHCTGGHPNRCGQRRLLGLDARGGLADYATAPAGAVFALPAGVPPEAGHLAEPLAVCVRGTRLGRVRLGSCAVVLGAGTIGLLSIVTARAAGASRVFATARHPAQRERALALGADGVFASAEQALRELGGDAVDVVIETVGGAADTLAESIRLVRAGGTVSMLGVFEGTPPLPALEFSRKEVTLVGSNCYGRGAPRGDFAVALDLLGERLELLRTLVTHRVPLDQVNRAFEIASDKSTGSIKVVVTPR